MSNENKGFDAGKAVDQIKADRNLTIIAGGAVAVIVGLFLPWYSVNVLGFSTSVSPGLNGTGILLLLASVAAVGAGLNVLNKDRKQMSMVAIIAGIVALLIMINNWPESDLHDTISPSIGYWLGLAGSIAMIVGGVKHRGAKSSKKSDPKPKN